MMLENQETWNFRKPLPRTQARVLRRWAAGVRTDKQRGVLLEVLTVRLGSMLEEEGDVFHQTLFYGQEERSLTTKSPTLHRLWTWGWKGQRSQRPNKHSAIRKLPLILTSCYLDWKIDGFDFSDLEENPHRLKLPCLTEAPPPCRVEQTQTSERELQDGLVALSCCFVERDPASVVRLEKPILLLDAQILQQLLVTWTQTWSNYCDIQMFHCTGGFEFSQVKLYSLSFTLTKWKEKFHVWLWRKSISVSYSCLTSLV